MANISDFISAGGGGGGQLTVVRDTTANQRVTANAGEFHIVTAADVAINLPASPQLSDVVRIHNRQAMPGATLEVFPGRNIIVHPINNSTIRGHFDLNPGASFDFIWDGSEWNVSFSGYNLTNTAFSVVANTAPGLAFTATIAGQPALLTDTARTGQEVRYIVGITDPDSTTHTIIWPTADALNVGLTGNPFSITSGGQTDDTFIGITSTQEVMTRITVMVIDPSGNIAMESVTLQIQNNQSPLNLTITSGNVSVEQGNSVVTEILTLEDPDIGAGNLIPGNVGSFTFSWLMSDGAPIPNNLVEDGCGPTDIRCQLRANSPGETTTTTVQVTADDGQGGTVMSSSRTLTWTPPPPVISLSRNSASPNVGGTVTWTASVVDPAGTFDATALRWTSSDGGSQSGGTTFARSRSTPGSITVTVNYTSPISGVPAVARSLSSTWVQLVTVRGTVSFRGSGFQGPQSFSGAMSVAQGSSHTYTLRSALNAVANREFPGPFSSFPSCYTYPVTITATGTGSRSRCEVRGSAITTTTIDAGDTASVNFPGGLTNALFFDARSNDGTTTCDYNFGAPTIPQITYRYGYNFVTGGFSTLGRTGANVVTNCDNIQFTTTANGNFPLTGGSCRITWDSSVTGGGTLRLSITDNNTNGLEYLSATRNGDADYTLNFRATSAPRGVCATDQRPGGIANYNLSDFATAVAP